MPPSIMSNTIISNYRNRAALKPLFTLVGFCSILMGILLFAFSEYANDLSSKSVIVILAWSILSAYPIANLANAFKTGVIVSKFSIVSKETAPFEFWLWVGIFIAVGLCLSLINLILIFGWGTQA
ncbi:hypothetical protein [Microbulbifer sp. ZKSA002]|uniref:hypothetical protein n=1 Tax=Microbulbifer sp. ZKSA002 TaxID=3243388 RepID=UPI00403936D7